MNYNKEDEDFLIGYSTPYGLGGYLERVLTFNHDLKNKGHEDDLIPYEKGKNFGSGIILENNFWKIKSILENELTPFILSRVKLSNSIPKIIFDYDIFTDGKKICGMTYYTIEMAKNHLFLNNGLAKIYYKIGIKNDVPIIEYTNTFTRLEDKKHYIENLAETLDIYYFLNNMIYPWQINGGKEQDLYMYDYKNNKLLLKEVKENG